MQIPLSWLREFLPALPDVTTVAQTLTQLGIEVDSIEEVLPAFTGVRVAEIREVAPLSSTTVRVTLFDGTVLSTVCCGASNCKKGQRVAWAPPGSHLHKVGEITEKTLHGASSAGMLCSLEELGLEEVSEGIWELGPGVVLGQDLREVLEDTILHLSLTVNLGHCMSVLGIARELSAALSIPLVEPHVGHTLTSLPKSRSITLHSSHCSQYQLLEVFLPEANLPSPLLWQHRLRLCGQRSHGLVIDLTNYLLFERGQPLHAFDGEVVQGSIEVRMGKPGERLLLLNDTEVKTDGKLVIADSRGPLALAGVMGGAASGISSSTRHLLIECAVFDATIIRTTSKQLMLRSDSSMRFERGIDEGGCSQAMQRVADLLQREGGDLKGMTQVGSPPPPTKIRYALQWGNQRLGLPLSLSEAQSLLEQQRCLVSLSEEAETLLVQPPSDRHDLREAIDLVEELARSYGYDHLPRPEVTAHFGNLPTDSAWISLERWRQQLIALGLQETITSSLVAEAALQAAPDVPVPIANPSSQELSVLRASLFPGLLEVLRLNQAHRIHDIAIFEVGHVHHLDAQTGAFREPWHLGILACGAEQPAAWNTQPRSWDFYALKGLVERWLREVSGLPITWTSGTDPRLHPHRQAHVHLGGTVMGILGELHPAYRDSEGLKGRPYLAELRLDALLAHPQALQSLPTPPEFPSTERDLTMALRLHQPAGEVEEWIESFRPQELERWEILSVFVDPRSPEWRRVTWRFQYRDPMRTLTSQEVDRVQMTLVEKLTSALASAQN